MKVQKKTRKEVLCAVFLIIVFLLLPHLLYAAGSRRTPYLGNWLIYTSLSAGIVSYIHSNSGFDDGWLPSGAGISATFTYDGLYFLHSDIYYTYYTNGTYYTNNTSRIGDTSSTYILLNQIF